jgi:pimeloyl-ACP methyl ester carboxylesterase
MDYTQSHQQLKAFFQPGTVHAEFPGSGISCDWINFKSENISILAEERDHYFHGLSCLNPLPDEAIRENLSFSYPVFKNSNPSKNRQAIILLHGLNERSWNKYMIWAHYLTVHTGRPVILFPIAFHMNRSPEAWGNPRVMSSILEARKLRLGEVPMSSFANVALSERLCEDPLRFFTSGQQSAADLVQLTKQLSSGKHPLFEKGTTVDLFAYSIGAFLAQILMLGNPGGLYTDSRVFLFCGGAFFDQMDGVSKLIMDQQAFDRLRQFYIKELNSEMDHSELLKNSMNKTEMGQSFLAMLSADNLRAFRQDVFQKMKKRIHAVALLKDKVIPAKGIMEAMNRFIDVEVLDFPYAYSHENPFPLMSDTDSLLVDNSFNKVFSKAAAFLR